MATWRGRRKRRPLPPVRHDEGAAPEEVQDTSFFSPAPTPVISSDLSVVQLQPEVGGTSAMVEPKIGETSNANVDDELETEGMIGSNDPNVVLNDGDIIADPGLRIPIEKMNPNLRDAVKRAYILKGPCQPKGHNYPVQKICGRNRSFHDKWFENHPWLEYSVAKDAAFCLYCYLFKQPRAENYGVIAFTVNGFCGWKDGRELIDAHGNGIDHNKSRGEYEAFKNQRQSVSHVLRHGSKKSEEEYKGRLNVILEVIRFLLLQAHAFHGHDEYSSSSNKGNFLELLQWYKNKNKDIANLFSKNQMTGPKIQKDLCRTCAELTTKAIIEEIGDGQFVNVVDEARDASIKEQMTVVLRTDHQSHY